MSRVARWVSPLREDGKRTRAHGCINIAARPRLSERAAATYPARMTHGPAHENRDEKRVREALRDLERAESGGEVIATSALKRAAEGTLAHFAASDAAGEDWTEVWGRRIARGAALVALILLAAYLAVTYL